MKLYQYGMSLVELMISLVIGLFLVSTFLGVYLAQSQTYRTGVSQGAMQNAQNAISDIITPILRGAGFSGCASIFEVLSNLTAGTSQPLGTLNTTPAMIMGYNANTAMTQFNAPNATAASSWTPALDSTLVGNAEAGSDVLVIFGAAPGTSPVGITSIPNSSNSFTVQNATGVTVGQYGAVSDCLKTTIFKITSVSGTTISHTTGGAMGNATDAFAVNYPVGSQFVPMQQTALFVGQGTGGQSSLMMATFNGSSWTVQPLIPGVDLLHVLYGIGSNGVITQYVTANNVTNWGQVYAVRLGFLLAGQSGSGHVSTINLRQFNIMGSSLTIPADNRLRHVYEMTVYLRNAIS